jgi:glutamyl-Q tRNA(Asp) synthetase
MPYIGRFAPSPTGPLHFGSLLAAVASWIDARAAGGHWLVRIEDLDAPRVAAGAADEILRQLEALELGWDGEVVYQSRRTELYREALGRLESLGTVYPCACTRKEIADSLLAPGLERMRAVDGSTVYPGTCRSGLAAGRSARARRVLTRGAHYSFVDRLQGPIAQDLQRESGDFVLWRADGQFAYQLAVVVDDAAQAVSDVVRGVDLLDSTPRQIHLQRLLGLPTLRYLHIPVAVDRGGAKLSKQNLAAPVSLDHPSRSLAAALCFLGHNPPDPSATPIELLKWAADNWSLDALPRARALPLPK